MPGMRSVSVRSIATGLPPRLTVATIASSINTDEMPELPRISIITINNNNNNVSSNDNNMLSSSMVKLPDWLQSHQQHFGASLQQQQQEMM